MEVLFFQIGIFIVINLIGSNSFFKLNIITFFIGVFTIVMVKTNPLMILQFVTIIISYSFCLSRFKEKSDENKKTMSAIERPQTILEMIVRLLMNLGVTIGCIYGAYKFTIFYWESNIDGVIILSILSYLILIIIILIITFVFGVFTFSYIEKLFGKKN